MKKPRRNCRVHIWDNSLIVLGGYNNTDLAMASCEKINLLNRKSTEWPTLRTKRYSFASSLV